MERQGLVPASKLQLRMASQVPPPASHTVYGVQNYTFGTKPPKFEKDSHVGQRMERLKER